METLCQFEILKYTIAVHWIIAIGSAWMASAVYLRDSKSSINRNFSLFLLFVSLWSFINLGQWVIKNPSINLALARFSILGSFTVLFFVFFSADFAERELSRGKKWLISLSYLPVVFFLGSEHNVKLINSQTCDVTEGYLYWYAYLLSFVYMVYSIRLLLERYNDEVVTYPIKLQIKTLIFSLVFLVFWTIIFSEIRRWSVVKGDLLETELLFLTGAVFSLSLIMVAMSKYWLMQFRSVPKNSVILSVVTTFFALSFLSQINMLFSGIVLALFLAFLWFLYRF